MSFRIMMSSNSLRNNTFTCEPLGVRYDVHRSSGVITINRWDASSRITTVARLKYPWFRKGKIQFGDSAMRGWQSVDDVLIREKSIFSSERVFVAGSGGEYIWKTHWNSLVVCIGFLLQE